MNRLCLALCLALLGLTGCGTKPPPAPTYDTTTTQIVTDPWPVAAATLRRQPDLAGARQIIGQITSDLANNPKFEAPTALAPDVANGLIEKLRLNPLEAKELTGANFTSLDAAYIAECLVFRDAARSLDLASLPQDRQVITAFSWVCRQLYLRHGTMRRPDGLVAIPPAPAQYVLARGYGTGLERAYVFLALLQQLGFDGCLIGPANREQSPSLTVEKNQLTKGPFWAVGARLNDGTILLFDPWRGEPLPVPGGHFAASLAQILVNPDQLKPWIENKERPWDVTLADVKAATVYAAVPFSALPLRMKLLEAKISAEVGVKLHLDPSERLARLGANAKLWAPSIQRDRYSYHRVLASFLPIDEGGLDATPSGPEQLYFYTTKIAPIPIEMFGVPRELASQEVSLRLLGNYEQRMREWILDVQPQAKIARGQFNETIRIMVEREQRLNAIRQQDRSNALAANATAEWTQKANELFQELSLARLPQNQSRLAGAEEKVQQFWNEGNSARLHIETTYMVPVGFAEASYYMAICKHEQAERTHVRCHRLPPTDKGRPAALAAAKDAWAVAKDSWERYFVVAEPYLKAYPERTAHVRTLAARADKLTKFTLDEW